MEEYEDDDGPEDRSDLPVDPHALGDFSAIVNRYGTDSEEAKEFMEARSYDRHFVDLANFSIKLRSALQKREAFGDDSASSNFE